MPHLLAYASLALSMALVGSYVALSKPLVALFPVMLLAWLRFGIGAVAMLRWVCPAPGDAPLTRRLHALLFLESFLGNFLFTLFMLWGVSLTSAVSAGVIMAAIPAVVAVMGWLLLRERVEARTGLAVACAALGIALLSLGREPSAPGTNASTGGGTGALLGNLLVFAAVLCEAAYAVIGKTLSVSLAPRRIAALINLWGLALATPLGAYAAWHFDFSSVPRTAWGLLLFYGLAASVWTVWLWMHGLRHVPASRAGVFTVMLPVSATLVGTLALGEPLGEMQALALAVSLLGVVLATRGPLPVSPAEPPGEKQGPPQ